MAGYTRTNTADIQSGTVVKSAPLNAELNAVVAAMHATTGHKHDGTSAEGGPVTQLRDADGDTKVNVEESADEDKIRFDIAGTEQLIIQDGAIVPTTDNDIDLGTSSLEFKDGYFDGTIHVDTLDVDVNATVAGTLGVTGTTTLAGILSLPDGSASAPSITNTGDTNAGLFFSASDEIAFTAGGISQVIFADGSIAPETDNDIDLGSTSYEFKDLYIDGIAHIDTLDIDENATVAGTLGVTGATTLGNILSVPDGSASAPSITNTGDTDSGLFFSAADTLAFSAGGTAQFTMSDGVIAPVTDSDVDLGTSSLEFKDGYFDGTVHTDAINLNGTAITSTAAEINILDGVTSTAAELNILDGVTSTAAELNTLDGVTAVVGELNALDLGSTAVGNAIASKAVVLDSNKDYTGLRNVTATGAITAGSFVIGDADINENDLESIDGITAGTIAASKAAVVDSNKDITGFRNVTLTGELDAATLDISGDADIDGTLETDALSIAGTAVTSTAAELNALDGITAVVGELNALDLGSTAVGTAIASKAVILDSSKDYTGIRNFTITGNLTVGGTQTVVDTVTMNAANAIVFEGATADDHETTLTITDPTADRTIKLPNQSGTLPVLAADSDTAITSTPAELNLLDGVTATTAELNILDGVTSTTAELNILDGVTSTAAELNILDGVTSTTAELNTLDGITAVVGELNALDLGSTAVGTAIASKAVILDSNKDYTGIRNFTTTGTSTFATLSDGSISIANFVNESSGISSNDNDTTIPTTAAIKDYVDTVAATSNNVTGLTAEGSELNVLDGASAGTIVNSKGVIYSSGGKVNATSLQIAGTDLTATAAEFNLLDGTATTPGTTAVAGGDGIVTNDVSASSGTMRQTTVDTFDTYLSGTTKTLTNKTLTSPVLTTPTFADGGFIADANGAEMLVFQTTSSAANAVELTNSATGNAVVVGAMGSDSNVDINLTPKGTGKVNVTTSLAVDNITVDGNTISSTDSNGNINLSPNGTGKVYITNDSYQSTLIIESTIDGTQTAPDLDLYKNSASPADGDYIGNILWNAENSNDDKHLYFQMLARSMDVTAGTEDAAMEMWSHTAGAAYERFTINPTEVVVNESSIISDLRVESNGNTHALFVDGTNNRVGILNSSPSVALDVTGAIVASDNVTAFSDERLKDNVVTIPEALSKVEAMRGVHYTKDSKAGSGVIAQELEKVAPELVENATEYKSVAYGNITGYLIEAVKELSAKVKELEARLN